MAADDRRARLAGLREEAIASGQIGESATATENATNENNDSEEAPQKPVLKFRNYAARDETLKTSTAPVDIARPVEFEEVKVDLDETFGEDSEEILVNVAPKKPNWDLRRDVAPKLAKLDRLTQQALLKLAREEASARAEDEKES